jgi:lysophospholipase L1-like esterase
MPVAVMRRRAWILAAPSLLLGGSPAAGTARPRTPLAATPIARTDLKWWRERHERKLAELRTRQPALVFYGDSITQQWERSGPPEWRDYAPVWQRFYGARNAVNLGYTGDTTASLIWRIQNGEAAGIDPRAAVILIGANNLGRVRWGTEDTMAGIERITRELGQRLPRTRLLLLGILPSERSPWVNETTAAINRGLAGRYPRGHAVTFLDLGHLFLREGRLDRSQFYDPLLKPPEPPLHPTAAAMGRLAEAMEPTLAAWLQPEGR